MNVEFVRDEGIAIELNGRSYYVRASHLGVKDGKILLCLDFAAPTALEPVKTFLKSYSKIRGARYAVLISGEERWIYDNYLGREVDEVEERVVEVRAEEKDYRLAAAFYALIHCECGVGDEGNCLCGLPPEW
ncbi:hypothetical protein [Archaeoglobus fulgidus]|uniref:Uncharacterized protein AF_1394 n=1 Tax=Archaeoglobus fulgidus (strain ATCC 49558 / DSM 4304 / JCM 9628 / NBRC 100126 / VC-16) TaxID=224325 RepID=Y1394_ARCFU|nr:hypothetical protein [Archaeoglobus fulgidus]O28877.1 RecName: Full=Uncharacterized protein AF_1394 [Archaeoglobus fulgidus DSM 4304]AAB89859.1 predicted coding region AF_1394 [Archaeoglobus fulgidus DSM 4304]